MGCQALQQMPFPTEPSHGLKELPLKVLPPKDVTDLGGQVSKEAGGRAGSRTEGGTGGRTEGGAGGRTEGGAGCGAACWQCISCPPPPPHTHSQQDLTSGGRAGLWLLALVLLGSWSLEYAPALGLLIKEEVVSQAEFKSE